MIATSIRDNLIQLLWPESPQISVDMQAILTKQSSYNKVNYAQRNSSSAQPTQTRTTNLSTTHLPSATDLIASTSSTDPCISFSQLKQLIANSSEDLSKALYHNNYRQNQIQVSSANQSDNEHPLQAINAISTKQVVQLAAPIECTEEKIPLRKTNSLGTIALNLDQFHHEKEQLSSYQTSDNYLYSTKIFRPLTLNSAVQPIYYTPNKPKSVTQVERQRHQRCRSEFIPSQPTQCQQNNQERQIGSIVRSKKQMVDSYFEQSSYLMSRLSGTLDNLSSKQQNVLKFLNEQSQFIEEHMNKCIDSLQSLRTQSIEFYTSLQQSAVVEYSCARHTCETSLHYLKKTQQDIEENYTRINEELNHVQVSQIIGSYCLRSAEVSQYLLEVESKELKDLLFRFDPTEIKTISFESFPISMNNLLNSSLKRLKSSFLKKPTSVKQNLCPPVSLQNNSNASASSSCSQMLTDTSEKMPYLDSSVHSKTSNQHRSTGFQEQNNGTTEQLIYNTPVKLEEINSINYVPPYTQMYISFDNQNLRHLMTPPQKQQKFASDKSAGINQNNCGEGIRTEPKENTPNFSGQKQISGGVLAVECIPYEQYSIDLQKRQHSTNNYIDPQNNCQSISDDRVIEQNRCRENSIQKLQNYQNMIQIVEQNQLNRTQKYQDILTQVSASFSLVGSSAPLSGNSQSLLTRSSSTFPIVSAAGSAGQKGSSPYEQLIQSSQTSSNKYSEQSQQQNEQFAENNRVISNRYNQFKEGYD